MLILKGIAKEYPAGDTAIKALKGVNIVFRDHELVSVVGTQGCGKTALLNIIGGLEQCTAGCLTINGKLSEEFTGEDWDNYRAGSVRFIHQNCCLFPDRTILDNVSLALASLRMAKDELRDRSFYALEKVGLADQARKKPAQLSYGQKRLAMAAMALAGDTRILLADEPAASLDPDGSTRVMEMLKEIAKEKLVVMATNDPELAMKYSTRIIRIADGIVAGDSNPYHIVVEKPNRSRGSRAIKEKKSGLSPAAVFPLSIGGLSANKSGTFTQLFAGGVGTAAIGIAAAFTKAMGIYSSFPYSTMRAVNTICILISATMIGIVTCASVSGRAGEIGIWRSIGMPRKDIMLLFCTEALVTGMAAGIIGAGITLLLAKPANVNIEAVTGISGAVSLRFRGGLRLCLVSVAVNTLSALIPSGIAAGREPAVTLRRR